MGVSDLQKAEARPLQRWARRVTRERASYGTVRAALVSCTSNLYNVQNIFPSQEVRLFSVPAATQRAGLLVLALGCSALAASGQAATNAQPRRRPCM